MKKYWKDRYAKLLNQGTCGMMTLDLTKEQLSFLSSLKPYLGSHKVGTLIDFGCGVGKNVEFLEEVFNPDFYIGCDISEEAIEYAKTSKVKKNREFAEYSEEFWYGAGDIIWTSFVLQHIPTKELRKILVNMRDSLEPEGGTIYALECTEAMDSTETFFSRNTYRYMKLFADAGFKNISVIHKSKINGNEVSLFEVRR